MKRTPIGLLVAGIFAASTAIAGGPTAKEPSSSQGASSQHQPSSSQQQAQQSPELVKQVQEKLSAAGHDAGPADGIMGPKTQAALKEFQEKQGLQTSGQLDQDTLAALEIDEQSSSTGASSPDKKEEKQ